MNGPPRALDGPLALVHPMPAEGRRIIAAPIRFFQRYISPIDGPRCQFAPTCSAFGLQAVLEHGVWLGTLMTADRLMRCTLWTDPGQYAGLPNGRLADPVANNVLGN